MRGVQEPRVCSVPPFVSSAGGEATELAASAGLVLDPWQRLVLDGALGERRDGRWSAFEVGLLVSRQNGKGAVLEARELAGLFLFGEQLILHSAHEFKTAQEHFRRMLALVTNFDHLRKQVARVRTSHGEEGIELRSGQRLRFVARTGPSGRGFSGDLIVLDEAMVLSENVLAALLPTMSARPNPQLWYTASAGLPDSEELRNVRARGLAGSSPDLAWFEWSAPDDADPDDPRVWAQANPALGIRVPEEFVRRERAAMPEAAFARERLGMWHDLTTARVIDARTWGLCADPGSRPADRLALAVDVDPDRSRGSVALAGARPDGRWHVELDEQRGSVGWMVAWVADRVRRNDLRAVVVDGASPAASLVPDLEAAGVRVTTTGPRDMAQACGWFFDGTQDGSLVHIDQPQLNAALDGARKRDLAGAWAWNRKSAAADITPLVAATLALWGARAVEVKRPKRRAFGEGRRAAVLLG